MRKERVVSLATTVLLCTIAGVAQAAPASNVSSSYLPVEHASAIERVARVCWWEDGRRWCGRVGRRYGYGYYYGAPRPEELHTGSTEWWRAMDREGRGGFGRR